MAKAANKKKPRVTDERVKLLVLLQNKRMCCVCHSRESVQLHHIDGDRSNTTEANLAVLCLAHHDQATAGLKKGQIGLGVKLTPDEVRAHKRAWEQAVDGELKTSRKVVSQSKRKQLQLLFEFELIKAKNEILVARRRENIEARLNFLTEFLIEEFVSGIPYRRPLLEAFSDIATRAAGEERVSLSLAAALPNLHLHLVGPNEVKIRPEDERALIGSMDILDSLGFFGVLFGKNERVVQETCKVMKELVQIGSWYGLKKLTRQARASLKKMQKEHERLSVQEKQRPYSKKKLQIIRQTIATISRT